jgi:hypothetical protein
VKKKSRIHHYVKSKAAKKGTSRPHGKRPRKHPFSEANLSPDR